MISFLKLENNKTAKTLFSNFTYLSILEIIGLLLPLISYPYVIRTVGADNYGVVVFCQAIIAYVVIIINFGYNVSATRKISENRTNVFKIREIYSSIVYQKLLIFAICLVSGLFVLIFLKYDYSVILLGFIGLCIQEVFFPTWLFQGLERMKFITIITFVAKCSCLILIFLFVHDKKDYACIPVLYSIGGFFTSVLSVIILKKKFDIYFVKVSKYRMKEDFLESLPFFTSRLSAIVMERGNVLVIGTFFSYDMVAIYDLCAKIVSILKTPFSLVAQVIYPNVAKSKNMLLVKKSIKIVLLFGAFVCLFVYLFAPNIILLLSDTSMLGAVSILKIMVLYVPIVGISYLFGASVLVVKGYSREYNLSVVYSVLLYILMLLSFISFSKVNLYTMALAFVAPELFVALYRICIVKYKNILN
ncbi:oligosaccharide flippase family protein [Escherichia coli]|uniref:oligosaccharide flippase family protein n=2 Tax=Parabacteroides distasonis TaxID=823 RepID=UPI0013F8A1AF|nr:oligosaccharide flippase family protein [Parabacteroides distasonis]MZZ84924.1 oligosaccharide flippase family protein [Escherichia coli]MDB9053158.1 oligosaccharide flippase family protein [Parabacteroides distasonis]MDB9061288.1 oligosaccharide flippase family protein [Parabacteroides distasonis]MDB9089616.1 oligosaccharide flippase family protein [Parabacteroides distasonis]MDB9128236.1 oligosaccharide flippase family protein [Parabacteroides distasonis]